MRNCAFVYVVAALTQGVAGVEPVKLSTDEILATYAANIDKIRSCIVKSETRTVGEQSWWQGSYHKPLFGTNEFRSDGTRLANRYRMWGPIRAGSNFTKEHPAHGSWLWDGKISYQYDAGFNSDNQIEGVAKLNRPQNPSERKDFLKYCGIVMSPAAPLLGHLADDDMRIDQLIKQSNKVSLRPNAERISGSECRVIEADTSSGQYTLWFDTQHGYNLAKATVVRKPGDQNVSGKLGKDGRRSWTMDHVRFQRVGTAWLGMEADYHEDMRYTAEMYFKSNTHLKIVEFLLDPDHERLRSFQPDDIPENTMTYNIWEHDSNGGGIPRRWPLTKPS